MRAGRIDRLAGTIRQATVRSVSISRGKKKHRGRWLLRAGGFVNTERKRERAP